MGEIEGGVRARWRGQVVDEGTGENKKEGKEKEGGDGSRSIVCGECMCVWNRKPGR